MRKRKYPTNEAFVLAAIQNNVYALEYASNELRNNREVVIEALKKNGLAPQSL